MNRATEEYKQKFELIFRKDIGFSRRLMPQIMEILGKINFSDESISDNEGTDLDFQGADLTMPPREQLSVGVRVRRAQHAQYDQFTQDDKERITMSCDVYFLGYATSDEKELLSYMIWNGKDYQEGRDSGLIPLAERRENERHSLVPFNCYWLCDIKRYCKVYAAKGKIGYAPWGIYGEPVNTL